MKRRYRGRDFAICNEGIQFGSWDRISVGTPTQFYRRKIEFRARLNFRRGFNPNLLDHMVKEIYASPHTVPPILRTPLNLRTHCTLIIFLFRNELFTLFTFCIELGVGPRL